MKKVAMILVTMVMVIILATNLLAEQPKVIGYIQMLGSGSIKRADNQFTIQRSEIWVKGEHDNHQIGYMIGINTLNSTVLCNASIWVKLPAFKFIPETKWTIGKYKPYFNRNYMFLPIDVATINYFQLNSRTQIVRDVGITGEIEQPSWNVKLAMTNGIEQKNNAGLENNNLKDYYFHFGFKPISQNLELCGSMRYGQPPAPDKIIRVWGADFLYKIGPHRLIGEFISSHQKEEITGWTLLAVGQVAKPLQLIGWLEDIDNNTTAVYQYIIGIGTNWFIDPSTKLALNFVKNSGEKSEPSQVLLQLQEVF